jgi:hypothetical protein
MSKADIFNARINDTMLGFEDHGIMTFVITVGGDGWAQGFGGVGLGDDFTDKCIRGILKALKVSRWEDLKEKYVRIKKVDSMIVSIGHITDDSWFEIPKVS